MWVPCVTRAKNTNARARASLSQLPGRDQHQRVVDARRGGRARDRRTRGREDGVRLSLSLTLDLSVLCVRGFWHFPSPRARALPPRQVTEHQKGRILTHLTGLKRAILTPSRKGVHRGGALNNCDELWGAPAGALPQIHSTSPPEMFLSFFTFKV